MVPAGADMRAGQNLDQRGFARAVLTDDGVDLAGPESEVDLLQGMGAEEALIDLAQFQNRRRRSAEIDPRNPNLSDLRVQAAPGHAAC